MHGGGSMMAGGYSGMQQPGSARGGGTPTAASPSSVSSSRRGALSPELAALLGRDAAKGGHMQVCTHATHLPLPLSVVRISAWTLRMSDLRAVLDRRSTSAGSVMSSGWEASNHAPVCA